MTDTLKYPFTFQELSEEEKYLVTNCYGREIVRVCGTKCAAVKTIVEYGPEIYNFKPRPDDIWLIGYPRSGTTMMQEILYLLGTDLDYGKAASTVMDYRFPFLENIMLRPMSNPELYKELVAKKKQPETPEELDAIAPHLRLAMMDEKRFIKSHLNIKLLHPDLLNVGCKVVFIARNIKDCIVSNYYFPLKDEVEMRGENSMRLLLECYTKNISMWGNYFEGLKEAWQNRNNKNFLTLFYEDVIADKRAAIKKISAFLEKDLNEEQLDKLVDHVSLDNFKKNKSLNNDHLVKTGLFVKNDTFCFIRKGGSGGWRDKFTDELNEKCNEWIRENLKDIPDFEMPDCWKKAMAL